MFLHKFDYMVVDTITQSGINAACIFFDSKITTRRLTPTFVLITQMVIDLMSGWEYAYICVCACVLV